MHYAITRALGASAITALIGGTAAATETEFLAREATAGRGHHDHGGELRQPCATLAAQLSIANTRFTASTAVAAGGLVLAGQPIPAHCVLTGKMFERVSPVD